MKKLTTSITFVSVLFLLSILTSACEGSVGPPGPPGPQGPEGPPGDGGLIGSVFEAQVNFSKSNDYQELIDFPTSIEVFNSDIVVAYILTAVDNGTDIWEPLPQTLFFGDQILLYGYDHTIADIRFFLDGTVDFDTLDPVFTDEVIFRVAIIPADFAKTIDVDKIEDVMRALKIEQVQKVY